MKKFIPRDFIFDLVARTNIVDVISNRVKLKKKGSNYFGCCPFHNEKTPSFSVSEKKQIYYCFGCGASGEVINFLCEFDRLSFVEAVEELANLQGLTVPYENRGNDQGKPSFSATNQRADLYSLMNQIAEFYHQQLFSPQAVAAQNYLQARGLNQQTIQRFNLGYSPDSSQATVRQVANNATLRKLYDQAGMLVTNDKGQQYDRFRGRIMFPIRDRRGNVIAFGGRTMKATDSAKYLNSPETAIFHKGRQLYGLYEALELERNPSQLLVVEGYMDVIALAQYGINYAVAALGTATTQEHIKLLFRSTDKVIFCYDGDNAGRRAAWRALNTLLPSMIDGKQIQFVFLPEGEDPDSLVRKEGKQAFETRLQQGQTLSSFLFEGLLKQVDLTSPEGRSKLATLTIPLLAQISAENYALNLKSELGRYLGLLEVSQIDKLIAQHTANSRNTETAPSKPKPLPELKITTMRILIGLLLQYPELAEQVPDPSTIQAAKLAGIDIFLQLLQICHQHPNITTAQLLTQFEDQQNGQASPVLKHLKALAVWQHRYEEDQIAQIFKDTLKALYDNILSQRQEALIAKERVSGLSPQERQELHTLTLVLSKKA